MAEPFNASFDSFGDAFGSLAGLYLERERIRATEPVLVNIRDHDALTNARQDDFQDVQQVPNAPSTPNATGVWGQRVELGGVQFNQVALWVAGGALATAVLLKVLK